MSKIYIDNPIDAGFTRVPNGLWSLEISLKAKGLFAFLLSFHHGAAPSVAEIETALGLGKDARQSAFRELVRVKLAGWRVVRNAAGRAVAKEMWISSRPLLLQALQAVLSQEPENPAISLSKTKTKKGAPLPSRPAPVRAGGAFLASLSAFQRSRILSGQSLVVDGVPVKPGSPHVDALRQALRSQDAENQGGALWA